MFRKGWLLILVAAIVFIGQSCTKTKNENCPFLAPHVVFVGFTEDESDTMIIRRFEKNSNFSKLIDTAKITRAHLQRLAVGKDSFRLLPDNYTMLETLFYVHDWQLYLPGAKHEVTITDAVPRFTTEQDPSALCHSYVTGVKVDGNPYSFSSWFDTPYRVFTVK